MPKLLLASHAVLLAVLSALAFPGLVCLGAGCGRFAMSAPILAPVAVALAAALAVTESFSGLRWPAVTAFAAALAGALAMWVADGVSPLSVWCWTVAWVAVLVWFVVLAGRERGNR